MPQQAGNVSMGAGLRPTAKAVEGPPDPTVRAPVFYPTGSPGSVIARGHPAATPWPSQGHAAVQIKRDTFVLYGCTVRVKYWCDWVVRRAVNYG